MIKETRDKADKIMKMREETQEFKTKLQTIKEARRKEKTDLVQKRNKSVEEKEGEPNVIESVESNYVTQRRGS